MSQVLQDIQIQPPDSIHSYKAGTIKYIRLHNFMCHSHFEQHLGPRVNFVIGPNGSGKSALLTALVVALGGRASITSRAKKTNDFVMHGKNQAKITVILHNYSRVMDKDKAFKPDDYGKFITIEKYIYKDDVSKLVLKNDKDRKVSERKQELDEMLDHFGILINNPICILNQEVSKTFLHSKKPEDKFELFMKATNLEQIEQDYEAAEQSHKEWESCNLRKTVAFDLLEKEYQSCREKANFLKNRAKLADTRQYLSIELLWALFRDNEQQSDILKKKVHATVAEISVAQKKIEQRMSKITEHKDDIETMRTNIKEIQGKLEETRKKLFDNREKESKNRTKQAEVNQKIDTSNRKINRLTDDNTSLEHSIAEMKRSYRDQNNPDLDNEHRKKEIERLERELEGETAKERSIRLHTEQLSSSMSSSRMELNRANARTNELKSKLYSLESNLTRLKNGQVDALRKYGDYVIKIREEIDKAHSQGRFQKKPVGPLGYYLRLKSPAIAQPLECHLKRNAHAFACDNSRDMATLSSIFKRIASTNPDFRQPSLITRVFTRRHDVSIYKAHHDIHKTMIDYLDIEEDAVYNVLVDRCALESILFIPDIQTAENLMLNPNLVPANTRCAYTKECQVMYPRTANGGFKSFANDPRGFSLFVENNTNRIKEVEREIENVKVELRDADNIVKNIQDSVNAQRTEYESNNKELRRLLTDIRKIEEKLLDLKTKINTEPQELSALEAELENNMTAINAEKMNIQRYKETLTLLADELRDIIADKEENIKVQKAREEERQAMHKMVEGTNNSIAEAEAEIKKQNCLIKRKNEEKVADTVKLDEAIEKAARSKQSLPDTDPPREIRPTDSIRDDIKKIDAQLRIELEEGRDPEEVLAVLQKRMDEITNLNGLKESNQNNFLLTTKSLSQRREGLTNLRNNTVSAVSATFSAIMRTMKMYGELQVNLTDLVIGGEVIKKARTLEMRIDTNYTPSQRIMNDNNNNNNSRRTSSQPNNMAGPRPKRARRDASGAVAHNEKENEDGASMTDTRSLSGGERSFSTVAFVLALWQHCASPFKLMDEIDVFMDMVTRRTSYGALIRFAQLSDEPGQFIFFSPLELPKIDDHQSFVRVFEMPAIIRKRPLELENAS